MEIIIAIAMLTGVFCYYQNNKIVITNIKLKQKINNKVRIAQISDLHSKEFGKNNDILYKKIIEQKPDIIVATGDLIDSSMKKLDEIMKKAEIKYTIIEGCSTIAIVGAGMNGVPGVMARIINTLTSNEIEILQTTDSNMTIWCLIYTSKVKDAIRLLHDEFNLGSAK